MKVAGDLSMKNLFEKIKASKVALTSVIAAGGVLCLFLALIIYTYAYGDIFPGVRAGDISLAGKSEAEAVEVLNAACAEKYKDATITVAIENFEDISVSATELGVSFPAEEMAKKAYAVGRAGNFFSRIGTTLKSLFAGEDIGITVNADEDAITDLLAEISKYDVEPVDADFE